MKKGFTLIELLVFFSIFTIVIVAFITILVSLTNVQGNESAVSAVNEESQYLLQQIQYYVSSARLVDMTQDIAQNKLTLREFSSSQDPTYISSGISFVQSTSTAADGATSSATFATTTTAGDFIIVASGLYGLENMTSTVSDSAGNKYTPVFIAPSPCNDNCSLALWYAQNIVGGPDTIHTTWSFPGWNETSIHEYSGLNSTSPFDQYNVSDTDPTGSSVTTGAVTITNSDELLFSMVYTYPYPNPLASTTISSGWRQREYIGTLGFGAGGIATADEIVTTAGTYSNLFGGEPSTDILEGAIATFEGLSPGAAYLTQGSGGSAQVLTSNKVTISNLSFTHHYNLNSSSSAFGTDSVSYSFTMSATSTNNKNYSQTFQSSVAVLDPVPKIVLLQQASTANNNASVSGVSSTYYTNNEAGDLLLAVVANTTSTATSTVSDTAGNTWTQVASTTYPAYNTRLAVFAATNASSGPNTVTAKFGPGAGYVSLFIYEYRGAATSSSFDASSTQLQPNTQTPSSGFANATSTVELLFGVTYNGSTSEIPSAGSGYTLETSSTVSHVFVEDSTQYITGPIAATWQYSGTTPSSSALIATFK